MQRESPRDLETASRVLSRSGGSSYVKSKGASTKPWRASGSSVLVALARAVKAAPVGGLRPALTALLFPA